MNTLWTSACMNPWFGPSPVHGNTCWDFAGKTNNEFVPTAVIVGSIAWETDGDAVPVAALPSTISADVGCSAARCPPTVAADPQVVRTGVVGASDGPADLSCLQHCPAGRQHRFRASPYTALARSLQYPPSNISYLRRIPTFVKSKEATPNSHSIKQVLTCSSRRPHRIIRSGRHL